jgi:hypothetical protein
MGLILSAGIHAGVIFGLLVHLEDLVFPVTAGIFVVMAPVAILAEAARRKNGAREEMWRLLLSGWPFSIHRLISRVDRYTAFRFWLILIVPLALIVFRNQWLANALASLWAICLEAVISGIWVYFYGMSFLILCSALSANEKKMKPDT